MSLSKLYGLFGVHGYRALKTEVEDQVLYLHVEPQPHRVCCPKCESGNVIKRGYQTRMFRTLPVGNKLAFVMAKLPRVECQTCGIVRQVRIGFADPRKTYTHALERYVVQLCRLMTIKDVAKQLAMSWDTVKEIEKKFLQANYANPPLKDLKYISIDEVCVGRPRKFLTLVLDLLSGAIVFVGEGKKASVLAPFWRRLHRSGAKIDAVAIDLGAAYLKAVEENLPEVTVVWDHFHVIKLMNEKLTQLRRQLYRQATDDLQKKVLKGTRWLLLADPENLDPQKGQPEQLKEALQLNEALSMAYYMKESLRQLWKKKFRETARLSLIHWYHQAMASGVRILQQFAKLLLANQDKLLAWYDHPITSAKTEATNNKLKTMQRMHYGLRDKQFFKLKLFQLHVTKYALIG
jgi:transposase